MDDNSYNYDQFPQQYGFDSAYTPSVTLNQYIARTFGWMFLGLLITFAVAVATAAFGLAFSLIESPFALIALTVVELIVVVAFSATLLKRPVGVTRALFFLYAVLNGVVFSLYFLMFEVVNLMAVFLLTALFFGAFALYGRFTKTDLSRLRPLLVGGLIFLLIAALLMAFIPGFSFLERVVCMIGIVVFLCFTAYDVQKIKANYDYFYNDSVMLQKASVYSALQLYLDFINLFLYLLRFFGSSRNSR